MHTGRGAQGVHPPAQIMPCSAASAAPKPPVWAGISILFISVSTLGLTFPWRVIASLPRGPLAQEIYQEVFQCICCFLNQDTGREMLVMI